MIIDRSPHFHQAEGGVYAQCDLGGPKDNAPNIRQH